MLKVIITLLAIVCVSRSAPLVGLGDTCIAIDSDDGAYCPKTMFCNGSAACATLLTTTIAAAGVCKISYVSDSIIYNELSGKLCTTGYYCGSTAITGASASGTAITSKSGTCLELTCSSVKACSGT